MTRSSWSGISFDGKNGQASRGLGLGRAPASAPTASSPVPRCYATRPCPSNPPSPSAPRRSSTPTRTAARPPRPGASTSLRAAAPAGGGPRGLPRCTRRRVLGAFRVAWEVFELMTLKRVYANQSTVELVIGVLSQEVNLARTRGAREEDPPRQEVRTVAHVALMLRI
jgi:hypothetical protein